METLVLIATISSILSGVATLHAIYCYIRGWWSGRREEYFGRLYYRAGQIWYGGTLLLILIFGYLFLLYNLPVGSKQLANEWAFWLITYIVVFHMLPVLHNTFSQHRLR